MNDLSVMLKGKTAMGPFDGASVSEKASTALKDATGGNPFGGLLNDKIEKSLKEGLDLTELSEQIMIQLREAINNAQFSMEDIAAQFEDIVSNSNLLQNLNIDSMSDMKSLLTKIETMFQEMQLPDARFQELMAEVTDKLSASLENVLERANAIASGLNISQLSEDAASKVGEIVGDDVMKHFNLKDGSKQKQLVASDVSQVMESADLDSVDSLNGKMSDLTNDLKRILLRSGQAAEALDDNVDFESQLLKAEHGKVDYSMLKSMNQSLVGEPDLAEMMEGDLKSLPKMDVASADNETMGLSNLSQINSSSNQMKQLAASVAIDARPGTPQFKEGFSEKVLFMVKNDLNGASIKLNPPELGPIEINIKINHNRQADLMITTQHSIVKDSVEHAMPRLREILSESGIQLNNVNVNDQSSKNPSNGQAFADNRGSDNSSKSDFFNEFFQEGSETDPSQSLMLHQARPRGLVDYYA